VALCVGSPGACTVGGVAGRGSEPLDVTGGRTIAEPPSSLLSAAASRDDASWLLPVALCIVAVRGNARSGPDRGSAGVLLVSKQTIHTCHWAFRATGNRAKSQQLDGSGRIDGASAPGGKVVRSTCSLIAGMNARMCDRQPHALAWGRSASGAVLAPS